MPLKKKLKTLQNGEKKNAELDKSSDSSNEDSNDESMSDCSSNSDDDFDPNEEIMIDFEARDLEETDLNSVHLLIQQKLALFQTLNALEMAKHLVSQEKIGNVIYQASIDNQSDQDNDASKPNKASSDQQPSETNDFEDDTIFGVLSLIDLSSEKCQKNLQQSEKFSFERMSKI